MADVNAAHLFRGAYQQLWGGSQWELEHDGVAQTGRSLGIDCIQVGQRAGLFTLEELMMDLNIWNFDKKARLMKEIFVA